LRKYCGSDWFACCGRHVGEKHQHGRSYRLNATQFTFFTKPNSGVLL